MDRLFTFCNTTYHKLWVIWYLLRVCFILIKRGLKHDWSKYTKRQEPYFRKYGKQLKKLTYGSPEYMKNLELLKPAIEDHYHKERHHPEHFIDGINCMNTIDIIEMLCDWKAAVKRNKNGDLKKSIEVNSKRFKYSESILINICKSLNLL